MNFEINIDKILYAKCKLMCNYKPLIDRFNQENNVMKMGILSNDLYLESGGMIAFLDCELNIISFCFRRLGSYTLGASISYDGLFKDIEAGLSIGLTHKFEVLGYTVLVNNYYKVILILDNDSLITGFSLEGNKISGVYEENGMICLDLIHNRYLVDTCSLECFKI